MLHSTHPSGPVDIHGHGVPLAFLEWVRATSPGGVTAVPTEAGYVVTFPDAVPLRPIAPRMLDFANRLSWLDTRGIAVQLVAPWLDVMGQELPPSIGQDWVRELNNSMAAAVVGSDGRLESYASLHLQSSTAAAAELERAANSLHMPGCMIPTANKIADPAFDPVWDVASSLDVPVVLHPPTNGPSSRIPGMSKFGGLYGRLIDTTLVAARIVLNGVFDRFPDLKLVLVHGGGFLPYQTGRLDAEQSAGRLGVDLADRPSDHVKRFYYDTVLMSPSAIAWLAEFIGADQIMIGSDYPLTPLGVPLIESLVAAKLDEPVRTSVCAQNARLLFRLAS